MLTNQSKRKKTKKAARRDRYYYDILNRLRCPCMPERLHLKDITMQQLKVILHAAHQVIEGNVYKYGSSEIFPEAENIYIKMETDLITGRLVPTWHHKDSDMSKRLRRFHNSELA